MPNSLRASMADLITLLRRLIGDPTSPVGLPALNSVIAGPTWSDIELQDALDVHRAVVRYAPCEPRGTPQPYTGVIQYLDYYATDGQWESDAQLFGPAWQLLTTATADYLTGHFTFAASQIPTVFITGHRYDVYAAAADVCEAWAAKVKLDFGFRTPEGGQFNRAEQSANLLALAERYRAKQEANVVEMVRLDTMMPGFGTF